MKIVALIFVLVVSGCASSGASVSGATSSSAEPVTAVRPSSCGKNSECLLSVERYCANQTEYESSPATEVFHKGRLAYFLGLAGIKTAPAPGFAVNCNEP